MDEIEEADNDIDDYKLLFTDRNKGKFNINIFRKPLNFLSAIYNNQISLKEAEIKQRKSREKIYELKYEYKPKYIEKEEINDILMNVNDMLEYRDKIIEAFRNCTFFSEHLKKSDDVAYDYVLEDVNNFIHKIELMAKKN